MSANTRGRHGKPDWHFYADMYPLIYDERTAAHPRRGDCPMADDLFDRLVHVNLNQWLTAAECRQIANTINAVLTRSCTPDANAAPWL